MEKPKAVRDAQRSGDKDALKRLARKGGRAAAESSDLKRLFKELNETRLAEKRAEDLLVREKEQAKLYQIGPEGDVLPPDEIIPL